MSKFSLHFAIFFILYCKIMYILGNSKRKGDKMSIIMKNAETMFEKFESKMEIWAEKLF